MNALLLSKTLGITSSDVIQRLREKKIDSRPFFVGMHQQPIFDNLSTSEAKAFPVSDKLSDQGLYLPSGLGLTDAMIERVCGSLKEILS